MINSDPMTMTDEEMITEFLDVIRICRKNDNMKLAFAETIWALKQYRRAEIAEEIASFYAAEESDSCNDYFVRDIETAWDAQHPDWPEEAK